MSSDFLTDFLASILKEQGVQNPVQVAEKAAEDLRKARIVEQKRIDTVEMHRKVDALRSIGVPCSAIAERLNLKRESVSRIVRKEWELRRLG